MYSAKMKYGLSKLLFMPFAYGVSWYDPISSVIPAAHLKPFSKISSVFDVGLEWKMKPANNRQDIPESLLRGFPTPVILTILAGPTLVSTLVFFSRTTIGFRDDRLFWGLLTEFLCSRALLSASCFDENLLSLSLLGRVILTGILDFRCREGLRFWLRFFSGWSHEAIASHPRFILARWQSLLT